MRINKIIAGAVAAVLVTGAFSGCSMMGSGYNPATVIKEYDFSQMELIQLQEPAEGAPTATFSTSLGDITVVLYPEKCPLMVENFTKLVEQGFYNDKTIYIEDNNGYIFSGIFNEETGKGAVAAEDGKAIPNEFSVDLWSFRGALLTYSQDVGFGDSRFFICGSYPLTEKYQEDLRGIVKEDGTQLFPDELIKAFTDYPGMIDLSGTYSVYAQTINGFDVLGKIFTAEPEDGEATGAHKAKDGLVIKSVTLGTYTTGTWEPIPSASDEVVSYTGNETPASS